MAVVGGGNLAWHLVVVLQKAGVEVALVARDPASKQGWRVPVLAYAELADFGPDLVFLAVPDDAIGEVSLRLAQLLGPAVPVVHTSGATAIGRIAEHFQFRGALWPIRSLRRGEMVDTWREVPLAYWAEDPGLRAALERLCQRLSDTAYALDDGQRAQLHLAAVFSNNFVTWLYQISYELCAAKDIPFRTLLPIIQHTALRQDGTPPRITQTGAAARGDVATMQRHLELLEGYPEYAALYAQISGLIGEGVR